MKKEDVTAFLIYLILIAAAIIFGITVLQKYSGQSGLTTGLYVLYIAGAIITGVVLNAAILELGHLAGAKLGRYKVQSVNILFFCWTRQEDNKFKFSFKSFEGLSGETKIIPDPNAKKEPNPRPYLLFGILFFLVELAITIVLFVLMQSITNSLMDKPAFYLNIAYFFITSTFIGALMMVYDILPFRLDPPNDGYQFVLTANSKNVKAYNELLRVQHEIEIGNTNVEISELTEITNFTADLNLNKVYSLLNQDEYAEAEKILNKIVEAKANISEKVYVRALAQILNIKIMHGSLEDAQKYLDDNIPAPIKTLITTDKSMVCLRATILIEGIFDNSKSECLIALQNVQKAYKNTPTKRQNVEVKLFNAAILKVDECHPKWEFNQYCLKVTEEKENKK